MRWHLVACTAMAFHLAAGSLCAQEREVGFTLGASVATLDRASTQAGDDPFRTRTGMTAGAYALLPVRDRIGVLFELLFTDKGASLPFHNPALVQGTMSTRFKFHYMDVPVLARVRGPRIKGATLHAFGGPTLSVRLSAKQQTVFDLQSPTGFERDLEGDEMERFDVGLTFGGALQLSRRLFFDARYTYGLNSVLADDNGRALSNRGLLVTAGVRVF
jgi:hypothetical protein